MVEIGLIVLEKNYWILYFERDGVYVLNEYIGFIYNNFKKFYNYRNRLNKLKFDKY